MKERQNDDLIGSDFVYQPVLLYEDLADHGLIQLRNNAASRGETLQKDSNY